jgi:hypothetical protein
VREVQSPDGRVWRVRRRWLPRRAWLPEEDAIDRGRPYVWGYAGVDWWIVDRVVVPAVMLVGDIIFFLVSLPITGTARLLGLRPWRIQAATIGRPRETRETQARGWSGSRDAIDELASQIASGA